MFLGLTMLYYDYFDVFLLKYFKLLNSVKYLEISTILPILNPVGFPKVELSRGTEISFLHTCSFINE